MANDDNTDLSKRVYLECECTDFDHTVRVSLWDWNNYTDPENSDKPEMIFEYRLNHHEGLWDRLCTAFNYVFGYKGETLCYHDVMVDKNGVDKLSSLCRDYKMAYEMYEIGKKQ
jgi:hypothetical protein